MEEKEFKIEGMSCHHCVMAVEVELKNEGFEKFKVEIGSAKVFCDDTRENYDKIKAAIENAGYKLIS